MTASKVSIIILYHLDPASKIFCKNTNNFVYICCKKHEKISISRIYIVSKYIIYSRSKK